MWVLGGQVAELRAELRDEQDRGQQMDDTLEQAKVCSVYLI
jgi:hypothetical protein